MAGSGSSSTGKRKLPVIQSTDDVDEAPRPKWQWILFDVLVTMAVWVGLSAPAKLVMMKILAASPGRTLLAAAPQMVAMVVATSFGGYLLGRFGGKTGGVREAVIAGGIVGALAAFIAFGVPDLGAIFPLAIAVTIVACAYGGAVFGWRKRSA